MKTVLKNGELNRKRKNQEANLVLLGAETTKFMRRALHNGDLCT
jgi:hypothetical protein